MERNGNYDELIDKEAAYAYARIISDNTQISSVFLTSFARPPMLSERVNISTNDENIVRRALELRGAYKLPFWDALMVCCFSENPVPERLLNAATYHQKGGPGLKEISRDEVLQGGIQKATMDSGNSDLTAITSQVKLSDGVIAHIPMLDFHCPSNNENLKLVSAVWSRITDRGGLILDSGESYHGFGLFTVSPAELMRFLGMALLFAPIVDRAYIAHQIIEGRCSLRISKGGRSKQAPKVVLVI